MEYDFIDIQSEVLTINKREYTSQLEFTSSRIRQDKKIELDMKQEYSGRELYEMIQNADDEGSPQVELLLTEDNHLHIKNWGKRPFTKGGMLSIMRSFISTKTDIAYKDSAIKPIGNKGLGFRSLLNWSDEIIIHSNGVQGSFSEKIAKREWNILKENGIKEGTLSEKDAQSFEMEREGCPLPILSIPEIQSDKITKKDTFTTNGCCTTDIEVCCKDRTIINDVEQKLNKLPSSVLLFLRNIDQIHINCKGKTRTIQRKQPIDKGNNIQTISIDDNGSTSDFVVSSYKSEDRTYEVAVAYPLGDIKICRVLHSYFPTNVRLNVPAIYHGTFELNASRNHLVQSEKNNQILQALGKMGINLAVFLTNNNLLPEGKMWDAFNLLNIPKADIESAKLSSLSDSIEKQIHNINILPTVNYRYSNIETAIWLGEKMSKWLEEMNYCINQNNRLIYHIANQNETYFSNEGHLSDLFLKKVKRTLDELYEDLNDIGKQYMDIDERAKYIDAIVSYGSCRNKLNILVDGNNSIITAIDSNPAYVLSMAGDTILPECLKIKAVSSKLISRLQDIWNTQIRSVTEKLQNISFVSNGDYTAIRKKIESWSIENITKESMREILTWCFKNQATDRSSFSSEFHLINRLGEKKPVCEMILKDSTFPATLSEKIADEWWLMWTASEWKEILGAENENDAVEFLYKVIGISCRVPKKHIYYGNNYSYLETVRDVNNKIQIDNRYCDNFDNSNKITKLYNYAYVPEEDFLSQFSLKEALGLLVSDEKSVENILNTSISLFYRTVKPETVQYSFTAYQMRSYKQFAPLTYSVINSTIFGLDFNYEDLTVNHNPESIAKIYSLLISLGAQTNITNLSLEQLYILLSQEVDSFGIQRRYRELREAIRSKHADYNTLKELSSKHLKRLWARKNGKLEWLPVEQVYYWDNDQLPQTILSNLPKLEIGSRVGEDSVAQIFGVNLSKNIDITFDNYQENTVLTNDLKIYLSKRIKYFLAYRIGDDLKDTSLIRQTVNALKQLSNNLHIFFTSSYKIDETINTMKEGDLLTTSGNGRMGVQYIICSSHPNCINAINDPVFCENLNEAVCMALKVNSSTMANYFRNIITHDIKYIEYISNKDITPETWSLTLKSIGISESEQNFWKSCSKIKGVELELSNLSDYSIDTKKYIKDIFPRISLPENFTSIDDMKPFELHQLLLSLDVDDCSVLGTNGLKDFYMEYFASVRDKLTERYNAYAYHISAEKINNNSDNAYLYIENYIDMCQKFNEPFYEEKAEEIKNKLLTLTELDILIKKLINEKFKLSEEESFEPVPKTIFPEYESILSKYHISESFLNQTEMLIGKFHGLEKLFEKQVLTHENNETASIYDKELIKIDFTGCHSILKDFNQKEDQVSRSKKGKGYISDRAKFNAGKKAELATFDAMKASPQFVDVIGKSKILNMESGNDNLHYDITYRKKDSQPTDIRYLEVKSMNGDSIIMSCHEYEFAMKNSDIYDLAVYHDGRVTIIESPFSSARKGNKLEAQPNSYQITIKWDY